MIKTVGIVTYNDIITAIHGGLGTGYAYPLTVLHVHCARARGHKVLECMDAKNNRILVPAGHVQNTVTVVL